MPIDTIYLAVVAAAFATFAITLASVSIWSSARTKALR
jgi:hypothetical protein